MAPKKKKGGLIRDLTVGEDFRIGVNLALKKFRNTDEEKGIRLFGSRIIKSSAYCILRTFIILPSLSFLCWARVILLSGGLSVIVVKGLVNSFYIIGGKNACSNTGRQMSFKCAVCLKQDFKNSIRISLVFRFWLLCFLLLMWNLSLPKIFQNWNFRIPLTLTSVLMCTGWPARWVCSRRVVAKAPQDIWQFTKRKTDQNDYELIVHTILIEKMHFHVSKTVKLMIL